MRHQEVWIRDGYTSLTTANTLFELPIAAKNRILPISPELTQRRLYFGILAPGTIIEAWKAEFAFRLRGLEVGRIKAVLSGGATLGTAPTIDGGSFVPGLPFKVIAGGNWFDYPPEAHPNARIYQTHSGAANPYECLIMLPTDLIVEADELEFSGQISVESATTAPMFAVLGIISESP